MKEVRRQRIMDEIELKDTKILPPTSLLSPSNNGYPSLRDVGRSKTDPGGGAESEGATPTVPTKAVISGFSFDSTKLSAQLSDIAFKRSNPDLSIDGIKQRTLRDIIGITVYQAKLLLQCWPNIYSTGTSGPFASQLYSSLGKRNPKAKTILTKANGVAVFSQSDIDCTSMHTKLTLELIDTIIRTLDNSPTNIINYLTEIGQCHRTLKDEGMSTAMWDDLGDAILEGVRKNDLVRKHKECRRAWLAIIAFITDNIKQGHNTFKASPSTNDINERNKEQN
uniref:Globin domain-containing protein n=1 Tax=Panagrolaimus superbus TaxID=310955 RepID=A0A914YGS6_9BILA